MACACMSKVLLLCLCVILTIVVGVVGLTSFSSRVQGQGGGIIVEDADYVSTDAAEYSPDIINVAKNVSARIVVEYGNSVFEQGLYESDDLNGNASSVLPRIVVEYADSILASNLERPFATIFTGIEKSFKESTLVESIRDQDAVLNNVSVSGDFNGTLDFTSFRIVSVTTGPFAGKGFSKGQWEATLEGILYKGGWEGAIFIRPSENRTYLKGALLGEFSGTVEGYLIESVPENGIYDRYQATWKIGGIGGKIISAIINLNGTLTCKSDSSFPAIELHVLQTSIDGASIGHYNGPLSTVITHLRIVNSTPYNGEGFSMISYTSNLGDGEGWTYDKLVSPGIVNMKGLFADSLFGTISATLDGSELPRTLIAKIERVDLGLPPMADLKVKIWGPGRASPGQLVTYCIELRNDGLKSAENVTLVHSPPFPVDFLSASLLGNYDDIVHVVRWDFRNIPPRTTNLLSIQARILWGLSWGEQLTGEARIFQKKDADLLLNHTSLKLTEKVKIALQSIWIAITTATGVPTFGETEYEAIQGGHALGTKIGVTNALIHNEDYGMEVLELSNAAEQGYSFRDNGWQTTDEKYYWAPDPNVSNAEFFNRIVADLKQFYTYIPKVEPDRSSTLTITVARDPNVKCGSEGYISQGQTLNYTIEYENEGEGIAFGVYFTDTLDEDLNESTLQIGPVISAENGSLIASPGDYNPATRTITWLVGEVGPGEGGYANFSAQIRNGVPESTEIINYATVYFPSVPEMTRTNAIVSIVGQPNIAIKKFAPSEIVIDKGLAIFMNVTVANEGYLAETFNLTIYANTSLIHTQNVTLIGRSNDTVIFLWNTTDFAVGNYTITVHVSQLPGEIDTDDNTLTFFPAQVVPEFPSILILPLFMMATLIVTILLKKKRKAAPYFP